MMSRIYTGVLIALVLTVMGGVAPAFARTPVIDPDLLRLDTATTQQASFSSAFRSTMHVGMSGILVPTVIEVPLTYYDFDRRGFIVVENETGRLLPSYLRERYVVAPSPVTVTHDGVSERYGESLADGDARTGKRFELPLDGESGRTQITLTVASPVMTSGLIFDFERNVALPTTIEVRGEDALGNALVLLSSARMGSDRVSFIPTMVRSVTVTLMYAQPLKINELTLIQDSPEASVSRGLRFLAQPEMTYTVYGNPDRFVTPQQGEAGDLTTDAGVLTVAAQTFSPNASYQPADTDSDGVEDTFDNCVAMPNADQVDLNGNGRGDACDDFDRDGVMNTKDNCINFPNQYQIDTDGDTIGDECDGEESRLTERLPWVPWVGMGIAVLVLLGLFGIVARRPMKPSAEQDQV